MVVHVWAWPGPLNAFSLSSLVCLADLGNVSGTGSRGRLFSLSVSARDCVAALLLTQSLRLGGGMLGLKDGMSVGSNLRRGSSVLMVSGFSRLMLLRGERVACPPTRPDCGQTSQGGPEDRGGELVGGPFGSGARVSLGPS